MSAENCGVYDGYLYKLAPEAKFTFIYCCTMKDFLLSLLGNVEIADILLPFVGVITGLLSEPACRLIKPLTMDLNLIEVLPPGTCFDIKRKEFKDYSENIGDDFASPRAFVKYHYQQDVIPYPEKFVEGKKEISYYIKSFSYDLLLHGNAPYYPLLQVSG